MKRTGLARRTALSAGKGLTPDPEKVREFLRRHQGRGFRERKPVPKATRRLAAERQDDLCVACQQPLGLRRHPHHVLPVHGPIDSWPHLEHEPDNIVMMHPDCHMRHESAYRRIRRWELPQPCVDLIYREGPKAVAYMEHAYQEQTGPSRAHRAR